MVKICQGQKWREEEADGGRRRRPSGGAGEGGSAVALKERGLCRALDTNAVRDDGGGLCAPVC